MDQYTKNVIIPERRFKQRIRCAYPALVRGRSVNGKKFEENATVINLSSIGAYVLINRSIEIGQELSVKIAFPTGSLELGTSKLATSAIVVRTEHFSEGVIAIAIKFLHYRFI